MLRDCLLFGSLRLDRVVQQEAPLSDKDLAILTDNCIVILNLVVILLLYSIYYGFCFRTFRNPAGGENFLSLSAGTSDRT